MDIQVDNLSFGYNKEKVLKNISCQFISGNFYAVIGPNGSGKSTFIRLLNRLLKPWEGNIFIGDKLLNKYSRQQLARLIGYVPQTSVNQGSSTVFDTIMLGRRPHLSWGPGLKDRQKVQQIMHDFSLDYLAFRNTNELSGGELQRVNIARALVQEPKILVLDEPTSSLDLKHQIEVMKLLKDISRQGITIIIAIHDLNLALRYANYYLLLKSGQIISKGGNEVITRENLKILYDVEISILNNGSHAYVLPVL
jgi:iron complex transport system ATP-binding protein